jgi:hypothetical protein
MYQEEERSPFKRLLFWIVGIYLAVVFVSSVIGWLRIGDVRDEFRAGANQASCQVLDRVEWRELECNGYYDKVVEHRDSRLREMGCVNIIRWHVENDNEPYEFNLWSLPLCWRPTFTL